MKYKFYDSFHSLINYGCSCSIMYRIHNALKIKRCIHTAVGLRKTSLLHAQIKNHATLAYKNSIRKCYEDLFLLQISNFNAPNLELIISK